MVTRFVEKMVSGIKGMAYGRVRVRLIRRKGREERLRCYTSCAIIPTSDGFIKLDNYLKPSIIYKSHWPIQKFIKVSFVKDTIDAQ